MVGTNFAGYARRVGKNAFWSGKRNRAKEGPLAGQLEAEALSTDELDAIGASIYKAMDDLAECLLTS